MKKITTVILAAGKSSRFKHNKSKLFQELCGLPIIDHVYKIAKKVSNKNVIIISNKNNFKDLKKKFPDANIIIQKNQNGTADAINYVKKYTLNTSILILFGDVPLISVQTIKKLINNFKLNKSIGSMIAFKTNNPHGYGRVSLKGKYVTSVIEEVNASNLEKKNNLCNSGIMICDSRLLFSNINRISNRNIKKEKYLPDIFSIFHNINKSFTYITSSKDELLGINTIKDLIILDNIYQEKIKDNIIKAGVIIENPDTVRLSYDTKIKKGSIIESFVTIRSGVSIKENVVVKSYSYLENCLIDSNSSIGPNARIRPISTIGKNVKIGNYVEIKNSKIGNKSSVSHLSYIGDSYIGKNVNIGAGTITCNYDGKKKNKTIIRDNVFVGSNSSLIAPIKIESNTTIGAGSVITQNIPSKSLAIERSKLKIVRKLGKK